MAGKQRVSYSLDKKYQELFRKISDVEGRAMTEELRRMLDARAVVLGIEPVGRPDARYFAPKSKASVSVAAGMS